MRPRQPDAIFHHEVAQCGAMAVHPERKHGAPGDLERHLLHRLAQIHRPAAGSLKFCNHLIGRRDHVRDQRIDGAGRERRRQGAALMLPDAAFGDQ